MTRLFSTVIAIQTRMYSFIGARKLQLHATSSQRGASLVEYALLLALIAVVCVGAVTFLGKQPISKFSAVGGSLNAAS